MPRRPSPTVATKLSPQKERTRKQNWMDRNLSEKLSGSDARRATQSPSPEAADGPAASKARSNPQACIVAAFGQCLLWQGPEAEAVKSKGAARETDAANPKADGGKEKSSAEELPGASRAGLKEVAQAAQSEGAAGRANRPTNGLRPSQRTKPTICSISRRKSFAGSALPPRMPRSHPSLKERPEGPLAPNLRTPPPSRTQMRQPAFRRGQMRRLSLKHGLRL